MEKDLLRLLQACVGAVVLLGTAILLFGLFPSMKSEAGAAWVQAVGSIAAIGAAIWVMAEQHRRDAKVREDEIKMTERRLLKSIRTEVEVLFAAFRQSTGDVLAKAKKGDVFDVYYRVHQKPFAVFDSHVAQIGVVDDDDVRRLIIVTYAKFNGILTLINMNNDLVLEKDAEFKANGRKLSDERRIAFHARMAHVANQLIDRYGEAASCVEQIKLHLERY